MDDHGSDAANREGSWMIIVHNDYSIGNHGNIMDDDYGLIIRMMIFVCN